jgi:hypothetical protein
MKTMFIILILLFPGIVPSADAAGTNCLDAKGRPVGLVEDDQLHQIARASLDPIGGEAVVFYNPHLLTWIHPETRLFFLTHECAHHRLGHPLGSGLTAEMESAADCWAVRELIQEGLLDEEGLISIQKDLYTFGREEWAGVPGSRRGINPEECPR